MPNIWLTPDFHNIWRDQSYIHAQTTNIETGFVFGIMPQPYRLSILRAVHTGLKLIIPQIHTDYYYYYFIYTYSTEK